MFTYPVAWQGITTFLYLFVYLWVYSTTIHLSLSLPSTLALFLYLPIIFFSTITGTANFAQHQFPASIQNSVPAMIGGINIISGLLATVMQFLKINELMERHNIGSQEWGKFSREIWSKFRIGCRKIF